MNLPLVVSVAGKKRYAGGQLNIFVLSGNLFRETDFADPCRLKRCLADITAVPFASPRRRLNRHFRPAGQVSDIAGQMYSGSALRSASLIP